MVDLGCGNYGNLTDESYTSKFKQAEAPDSESQISIRDMSSNTIFCRGHLNYKAENSLGYLGMVIKWDYFLVKCFYYFLFW